MGSNIITRSNKIITSPTLTLADTTPTADGSIGFDRTNEDLVVGDGSNSQLAHMGAWKTWTPSWTNLTVGNATVTAKYSQVGKIVDCQLYFTWGSTTSASGTFIFSLPVTSVSYPGVAALNVLGDVFVLDTGTATYNGIVTWASTTTAQFRIFNSSGTYVTGAAITDSVPMTWTEGDALALTMTYEAA